MILFQSSGTDLCSLAMLGPDLLKSILHVDNFSLVCMVPESYDGESAKPCLVAYVIPSAHLFVQVGFSLAAKAAMPIFWSSLPNRPWNTLRSYSTPSRIPSSWLLLTTSLAALTAIWL